VNDPEEEEIHQLEEDEEISLGVLKIVEGVI
jgi:hypothetical protein